MCFINIVMWKSSVGLIMWEMKKYCSESRSREISYMKYVNGRRTGLVTFCVETAFYNGLLKERYKGGTEVTGRQRRRRKKLLGDLKGKERILSFERESSGSHYAESSLRKRIWTCRKTTMWTNVMWTGSRCKLKIRSFKSKPEDGWHKPKHVAVFY
jgi:hypothetical protein